MLASSIFNVSSIDFLFHFLLVEPYALFSSEDSKGDPEIES